MPAKAGIHLFLDQGAGEGEVDSGLRRNDEAPLVGSAPETKEQ